MAAATPINFGDIAVLIGDDATPEVFTAPCGLTELTETTNVETNTTNIPDCNNVDIASWLAIDEVSRQKVVSGNGMLSQEYFAEWNAWDLAGGTKNIRVLYDISAGNGGGYLEGPAVLTTFEKTGSRGSKWTVSVGMTFDGKPTWVPGA